MLAPAEILSDSAPPGRFPLLLLGSTMLLLWFILCRQLHYEWSANEQYSYGWFVPLFAAFLLWLRWNDWKNRTAPIAGTNSHGNSAVRVFIFAVLLFGLLPIRLFEIANPDWRPLSWMHAFSVVGFTLVCVHSSGGIQALKHFAFPVCFILVAVPWISPVEEPIVEGLMKLVARVAAEAIALCGIPAQLEGSLVRVSNGVVGVSEACSGVRSLQTSLMIGLLFGELKRLTITRRFVLVFAALVIALLANFARAFFLVWVAASQNLAEVERWHGFAGDAIVVVYEYNFTNNDQE